MFAYLSHNLLAKISATVEHCHDNAGKLEALVRA
jgi:hypothetical protein